MPLVISHKAKCRYYISSEERLAEILGHSDFEGEYWGIGDTIVFEDGTEAKVEQAKGEVSHAWSERSPSDLKRVVDQINVYHPVRPLRHSQIDKWEALFSKLAKENDVSSRGCMPLLLILAVLGMVIGIPTTSLMF